MLRMLPQVPADVDTLQSMLKCLSLGAFSLPDHGSIMLHPKVRISPWFIWLNLTSSIISYENPYVGMFHDGETWWNMVKHGETWWTIFLPQKSHHISVGFLHADSTLRWCHAGEAPEGRVWKLPTVYPQKGRAVNHYYFTRIPLFDLFFGVNYGYL